MIDFVSFDYINIGLAAITTICAVVQVFIAIYSQAIYVKYKDGTDSPSHGSDSETERFVTRSRIVLVLFLVSVFTSIFLWCLPQRYDFILYTSRICPIVSCIIFACYAAMAKKSFNTDSIIAPSGLWEMLFNKIPSFVNDAEGPYRIILTQIGNMSDYKYKLSEEYKNKNNQKEQEDKDEQNKPQLDNYTLLENEYKQYQLDESGTPLYRFENYPNINNLLCMLEPDVKIHGIIVFIGSSDSYSTITQTLAKLGKKASYIPIAYYSFSDYPTGTSIPPYTNLKGKQPCDFVNHLVLRHYTRSLYWKKLCDRYHYYMKIAFYALSLFLMCWVVRYFISSYFNQPSLPALSNDSVDLVKLTNVFFEKDSPARVKVWKLDSTNDSVENVFNSGDAGNKSTFPRYNSSMVKDVMKAQIACLWVPKDFVPLTAWDKAGKLIDSDYRRKSNLLLFEIGDSACSVKWHPNPQKISSLEDERIRIMYSFDGIYAVEVIYDPAEYYTLYRELLQSNSYLAKLQQYLLAYKLIDKERESSNKQNNKSGKEIKNTISQGEKKKQQPQKGGNTPKQ